MLTKEEHIQYWISSSEKDWKVIDDLYKADDFVYSLFFAHLVIEKICKALWVKNNENNYPPKVHNLVYLLENARIEIEDDHKEFALFLNDFQLQGRYPDYEQKIFEICTKQKTDEILDKVKNLRICLLNKLQ